MSSVPAGWLHPGKDRWPAPTPRLRSRCHESSTPSAPSDSEPAASAPPTGLKPIPQGLEDLRRRRDGSCSFLNVLTKSRFFNSRPGVTARKSSPFALHGCGELAAGLFNLVYRTRRPSLLNSRAQLGPRAEITARLKPSIRSERIKLEARS